jgi:hypothetical protein
MKAVPATEGGPFGWPPDKFIPIAYRCYEGKFTRKHYLNH